MTMWRVDKVLSGVDCVGSFGSCFEIYIDYMTPFAPNTIVLFSFRNPRETFLCTAVHDCGYR